MAAATTEETPEPPRPTLRPRAARRLLITRIWLALSAVALVASTFVPLVKSKNLDGQVVGTQSLLDFGTAFVGGHRLVHDTPWLVALAACLVSALVCVWGIVRGVPQVIVFIVGLASAALSLFALMTVLNGLIATRFTAHSLGYGAVYLFLGACGTMLACLIPPLRRTWARSNRRDQASPSQG